MSEPSLANPVPGYRDKTSWYLGLSMYWFATSAKWFILLLVILPAQVAAVVPGGEKSSAWGMVFAIGATWAMIGPSLFGFISDRYTSKLGKRQPFIAIGAALTVIALMFLANANSLWVITVGYLLLQFADDVGTGPYSALIPEMVPEERRGRASGMMGALTLAAQLFIGVVAMLVGGDIKQIYIVLAVTNILCALIVLYTLRGAGVGEGNFERPRGNPVKAFVRGWVEPWKSRDFFWVWFTRFLNAFGFYLVVNYLQYYMADSFSGYRLFSWNLGDPKMATNVLALTISLCGGIGAAVAGRAADSWGRKRTIYVAGTLMAATIIPAALSRDFTTVWFLALFFGVGYGMYLSADWALVSDVLPNKETAGTDMGVWQMSNSAVQIFTGLAGMLVTVANRYKEGFGYQAIFFFAAFAFLLSTVLVKQVRGSR